MKKIIIWILKFFLNDEQMENLRIKYRMKKAKIRSMDRYLEHVLVATISILIVLTTSSLTQNWQSAHVIAFVQAASSFITNHSHYIEIGATIFIAASLSAIMRINKHYKTGAMALAAGMFLYKSNQDRKQLEDAEYFLREQGEKSSRISILGATGWETFGDPKSPLHDALKKCSEARIILMYPLSEELDRRAENLEQDAAAYREEIYKSINFIDGLRDGVNPDRIKLRMYLRYPMWKYIFLGDRFVWVQQYPPRNHVKTSPCFAFEYVDSDMGIYSQLYAQFTRQWESPRIGTFNFKTRKVEFYENGSKTDERPIIKAG